MHVWSTYDPLCTEYSVQVVIVNICTSMPLQSTSKGLLYSVRYQSAADRNGQRQMQLNRCRRRPPHGERRNLPIATSTCKVLWLRHMQVRCGVQWKQKICVTAAAQSLQYVQYVQSTVLYSTLYTRVYKYKYSPQWISIGNGHHWMFLFSSRSDNDVS